MTSKSFGKMRHRWDRFAGRDALYFACTNHLARNRDAFYESGRAVVESVIKWAGDTIGRSRMLEIGCGPGRTAFHFATQFEQVDAIDISPEMIRIAAANKPPGNLRLHVCDDAELTGFDNQSFDLVYSSLVFQHIPDEHVIAAYLSAISRVLRHDGRAVLQFDTRPPSTPARLAGLLPDALLPRTRRRYIRRYRREVSRLRHQLDSASLRVVDERRPQSAEHEFMLTTNNDLLQ